MTGNGEPILLRTTRWPYRLAMSVIVAGVVTLGAVATYILWPSRLIYISEPIGIETPVVVAGDYVALIVDYDKPYEHEAFVGVTFASRGTVALSSVGLSSMPVGSHHIRLLVQTPSALPEGEYIARLVIDNPVRLPLPSLFGKPIVATSVPFRVVRR